MKWWRKSLLWWAIFLLAVGAAALLDAAWPAIGKPVFLLIFFATLASSVRYLIFGSALLPWPEAVGAASRWRVSVVITASVWGVPAISMVLAAPAGSREDLIGYFTAPASNQPLDGSLETLCVLAIPTLVLLVPAWLHARERAWRDGSPVPAWLAAMAAVLTAAALVLLHFRGALAGLQPTVLLVAAFGAAVLLAPLYRSVANGCWAGGVAAVLDPAGWWRSWCVAWAEIRGQSLGRFAAADDLAPAEAVHVTPHSGQSTHVQAARHDGREEPASGKRCENVDNPAG